MNHLAGTNENGKPFYALVLEPGNIARLKENKPIRVRVEDMFPDGIPPRLEILIAFSETPIADAREFKKHAAVAFDERTPVSAKKQPHCVECKSTFEQFGMMTNETPYAVLFCPACGCVFGVILKPQSATAPAPYGLKPEAVPK